MKKSIRKLLVTAIFVFSISLLLTDTAQAKPKLNKTAKTITVGKSYTLKVKGLNVKKVKKVTFKTSNKKVVSIKKKSKSKAVITAKKNGKATIKVTITYKNKVKSKKKVTLKCKVTVQSINEKESTGTNGTDVLPEEGVNSIDWDGKWEDVAKKLKKYLKEDITEITDSILKYDECTGETRYGFITSPFWIDIDWYNEKEYKEIMAELKRIVEVAHISDEMTAQEKAYRLGRYLAKNIDYYLPDHEQTVYGTLFNRKTVCGGYSHTYAVLCRYIGIKCDYVETDEIINHAWNIIKLGDYWYSVDITEANSFRNSRYIPLPFFREWDYVGEKKWIHLREKYCTPEYKIMHPIDTMSYNMRCKQEGMPYLTDEELYNLPE